MSQCPCGSGRLFDECCRPILAGGAAASPEALMRSRYSAFVTADIDHLENSLAADARDGFDRADTESWAKEADWQGLEIRSAAEDGDMGSVEFVARYRFRGKPLAHHELASFRRDNGRWAYVDGIVNPKPPQRVATEKVGRNDPCPCGSGQKFKKCCGA